jgi:hypothetical protein
MTLCSTPSSLPSADAPSLIFCTVAGREPTGPNIWLRSSASFTGLPTAFAAIAARKTCDQGDPLLPNPPPV